MVSSLNRRLFTWMYHLHVRPINRKSEKVGRVGPSGTIKRLINEPSVVLLIIDNGVGSIRITELVNLGLIPSTDCEPVLVGIAADLLALVKETGNPGTENITAEIN